MPISENLAKIIKRVKEERNLSMPEMADELNVAKSQLEVYLSGEGNPRADTLELLAEKLNVSIVEIVSGPLLGQEQAETIIQAAKEFSDLLPEQRERGLQLFHDLMELFAEGEKN